MSGDNAITFTHYKIKSKSNLRKWDIEKLKDDKTTQIVKERCIIDNRSEIIEDELLNSRSSIINIADHLQEIQN